MLRKLVKILPETRLFVMSLPLHVFHLIHAGTLGEEKGRTTRERRKIVSSERREAIEKSVTASFICAAISIFTSTSARLPVSKRRVTACSVSGNILYYIIPARNSRLLQFLTSLLRRPRSEQ